MDHAVSSALIQDVIKQQIDLEVSELQETRNIYVSSSRFHNITMLQGQLAFYVGAAKAESIVMNLYMERMQQDGGTNGLPPSLTQAS